MSWLSDAFKPTKSKGGFEAIPLAAEQKSATQILRDLMMGGTPDFPTRQIIETPAEKTVEAGLTKYAGGGLSDAYSGAKAELEKIVGGKDITKLPEYEPIVSRVKREGDETVNRLLRRIQMSGMATSSPQGKQLGREVGRTQDTMLATLAPFAEAERSRRFAAIPLLQSFGQYETEDPVRRAAAVKEYGSKAEQERADATFQTMMLKMGFPYEVVADLASRLLADQRYVYNAPAYGPSMFSQVAGGAGDVMQGYGSMS